MFARNKQGERRASPSLYRFLLTAHIAVSVGWLGVVFAKIVLGIAALTTANADTASALFTSMRVLNVAFPPVAILTLITGVFLSLGTKWGLIQHYWVATKIVLTVAVVATAVQLSDRFVKDSAGVPLEMRSATTLLLGLGASHLLMLAVATVVSVYKPWGKTWFSRRTAKQGVKTGPRVAERA